MIYTGVETDPNRAPDCDPNQCVLPDCFCSADGTRIPGGLEPSQVNAVYKILTGFGFFFFFFCLYTCFIRILEGRVYNIYIYILQNIRPLKNKNKIIIIQLVSVNSLFANPFMNSILVTNI